MLLRFSDGLDDSMGSECRTRRDGLERSPPTDMRRSLYQAFAEVGMGNGVHLAGRKAEKGAS